MRFQRIAQPGNCFIVRFDSTGAGYDFSWFMAVMAGTGISDENDRRHISLPLIRKKIKNTAITYEKNFFTG
ncbi:hypothetical protein BFD15_13045 [Morganella morganii]|nr:hypothetical protein BFD15_13045 [Morganella morganii]